MEACVAAYAQTVAMCPGDHWRTNADGGRERVETSALNRILRRPNDYLSISDFLMNLTRRLYEQGEAFALVERNDRQEISALHLIRDGKAFIADEGSVFYALNGNEILERRVNLARAFPARDVLHIRLHTPTHPLKGVSPILANTLDLAASGAVLGQQIAFYLNQARPSYVLETDEKLTVEEIHQLRDSWNAQTQGENSGGSPILGWGLKAKPVTLSPKDGQIADLLKMSQQNVALAFRMPLQVLGIGDTPFASTESLMASWRATGLGFCLNHIEEAFGNLFGLRGQPDEYLEFSTDALMRSSFKERVEGWAQLATSGIASPDRAAAEFGWGPAEGGHGSMPRVQQQVVPLSYGSAMKPPEPAAALALPAPADPDDEESNDTAERGLLSFTARDFLDAAEEHDRRIPQPVS